MCVCWWDTVKFYDVGRPFKRRINGGTEATKSCVRVYGWTTKSRVYAQVDGHGHSSFVMWEVVLLSNRCNGGCEICQVTDTMRQKGVRVCMCTFRIRDFLDQWLHRGWFLIFNFCKQSQFKKKDQFIILCLHASVIA